MNCIIDLARLREKVPNPKEERAATCIQRAWRNYRGRKIRQSLRNAEEQEKAHTRMKELNVLQRGLKQKEEDEMKRAERTLKPKFTQVINFLTSKFFF
jgi:hypothetical protein